MKPLPFLLALPSLFLLAGCPPPVVTKPAPDTTLHQQVSVDASDGQRRWTSSPDGGLDRVRTADVTVNLPSGGGRVAFLLTNTNQAPTSKPSLGGVDGAVAGNRYTRLEGPGSHGPFPKLRAGRSLAKTQVLAAPAVGDALDFKEWDYGKQAVTLTATHLQHQVTAGGRTLNLWVADDSWDGNANGVVDTTNPGGGKLWSTPDHLVTPAMVTALADKFLKDGTNDIYGWVTGIFGKEWADSGVQPPLDYDTIDGQGTIHIFIKNLNPQGTDQGRLMGYFWDTNNYTLGVTEGVSNEKILFTLDADSLADPDLDGNPNTNDDRGTWSLTSYWPGETVSTLAHEFQHMIQFYQKQVLNQMPDQWTDAWINEMASMVTEDLLADKLGLPGPQESRLPLFNWYHDQVSLTYWPDSTNLNENPLPNYSQAYAFGAWLVRNWGGPALFRSLVQSPDTDASAVVNAVNAVNAAVPGFTPQTYTSLVRQWGLATYLRDSPEVGLGYLAGNWTLDGLEYRVPAIDLGKLPQERLDGSRMGAGPRIHDTEFLTTDRVAAGATFFYDAGVKTGTFRTSLVLPVPIQLTVVVTPTGGTAP